MPPRRVPPPSTAPTPASAERLTTDLKLAIGVAAIAAPAGLAVITARRGNRTYSYVWATLSITAAAAVALTMFPYLVDPHPAIRSALWRCR
jgi:hypothetical protein